MTAVPPFGTSLASAFSPAAMGGPAGRQPGTADLQALMAAIAQQMAGRGGALPAPPSRSGQPTTLPPLNLSGVGPGIQNIGHLLQQLRSLIGTQAPPVATMPTGPGLATGDFTPGGAF
jgi:hypothetical protein